MSRIMYHNCRGLDIMILQSVQHPLHSTVCALYNFAQHTPSQVLQTTCIFKSGGDPVKAHPALESEHTPHTKHKKQMAISRESREIS